MNESEVYIGKKGRIVSGDQAGDYILIQDDSVSTGGYLILTSPNKDFSGSGFDNWAESVDDVRRIIKGFKWEIEWLNEDDKPKGL
jgi:hypothetical protein